MNEPSYWSGEGVPDNKTALDPEDDVAHVKWGELWRMPTVEEFDELYDGCFWEWTKYNGVKGHMAYSFETGNKIFLPAAGYRYSDCLGVVGSDGGYWSSSLGTGSPYYACYLYFSSGIVRTSSDFRSYGQSVRPVSE